MLDLSAHYEVNGYKGIAVRVLGYAQEWQPLTYLAVNADTGEEMTCTDETEGEWYDDRSHAIVTMVGDDRKITVDVDELTMIDESAHCAECGQVGCAADGRDSE